MGVPLLMLLLITAASGCVSKYAGPPAGAPEADITFSLIPGERKYGANFRLMQPSSRNECFGDEANLGQIKYRRPRDLTGIRIPADREVEISVSLYAPSFAWGESDIFRVLFTPINGLSYRFEVEWDKDYRDVRVIELTADGQMRQIEVRGEECTLFTGKRKPIKLG
jgi:hypothetical protein